MIRTRIKIREGVSRGLCGTCKEAHITTDQNGRQTVYCNANSGHLLQIIRPVAECNQHRDLNYMSEWEASRVGWVLEVKGQRVIGFKPPDKDD